MKSNNKHVRVEMPGGGRQWFYDLAEVQKTLGKRQYQRTLRQGGIAVRAIGCSGPTAWVTV